MMDPVFDAAFYRQQNALSDQDALTHFLTVGDRLNCDPSPYFSTGFYKARYPDWQDQGARTAVEDFLRRTAQGDMRQPHPMIDPPDYIARYPDLAGIGAEAALHFMRHGDAEGRTPSTHFDAAFYRRCYLALDQFFPFRHFITIGRDRGYLPKPQPQSYDQSMQGASGVAPRMRPLLICLHDAQPAGVPILTLDLAQALARKGWQPIFALQRAGPLLDRFKTLGPCFILAEGWDVTGLAAGLPDGTPILVTTSAASRPARMLAQAGHRCIVLVHEMADYIIDHGHLPNLIAAQHAGAHIVASMPRTAKALADRLDQPPIILRPGIILPATPITAFRRAGRWRRDSPGPVFIGAGHADHRKGFDLFLEAATRIRATTLDARFVWLGALDGWAQSLAGEAIANGLDLTLPGFVDDALAWYRASDVYLLTSRQDPGPTTVIHAAAVGTPFVGYAADIGIIGMTEGLGHFVPCGDVDSYVALALKVAAKITPESRRQRRRIIRAEAGFAPYADGIAALLSGS